MEKAKLSWCNFASVRGQSSRQRLDFAVSSEVSFKFGPVSPLYISSFHTVEN